ncbi:hypothetical protein [Lactiplantibacillus plantarum]|uniref:hypothetical protein n=1 Tax=Lactiplantibacillus plantarum TaxID=1590 RepID=UPI001BABA7AE|nr:hypothetical protein [Lactiplantibacillus plantarum]MBS0954997.1 hypothetical protein [Lactiplantibacillus plantarum]
MFDTNLISKLCDIKKISSKKIGNGASPIPYIIYHENSLLAKTDCLEWMLNEEKSIDMVLREKRPLAICSDERFLEIHGIIKIFQLTVADLTAIKKCVKCLLTKGFNNNELSSSAFFISKHLKNAIQEKKYDTVSYLISKKEQYRFVENFNKCEQDKSLYYEDLISELYVELTSFGSPNGFIDCFSLLEAWKYSQMLGETNDFSVAYSDLLNEMISCLDLDEFEENSVDEIAHKIMNEETLSSELMEALDDVSSDSGTNENGCLFIRGDILGLTRIELFSIALLLPNVTTLADFRSVYMVKGKLIIPFTVDYAYSTTLTEEQFVDLIISIGRIIETLRGKNNAKVCNK